MNLSYWMVLAAAFLPVATVGSAKARSTCDYADPRTHLARLQGWRARRFRESESLRSTPAFAAGVIIAQLKAAPHGVIDRLAVAFSCRGSSTRFHMSEAM